MPKTLPVDLPHCRIILWYTLLLDDHLTCNLCFLSLCTMLSLQWEPEIIAVAVMYLAGRLCKFDIQEWTSKQSSRRWWEQFVQDVPVELLEGRNLKSAFNQTFLVIRTPVSSASAYCFTPARLTGIP